MPDDIAVPRSVSRSRWCGTDTHRQAPRSPGWRPTRPATALDSISAAPMAARGARSSALKRKPKSPRHESCGRSVITSRPPITSRAGSFRAAPADSSLRRDCAPISTGRRSIGDWSWSKNDFVSTQPFRGLIVANILLNSWDWKTSNNKIYQLTRMARGDSSCATSAHRSARLELEAPLDPPDSHSRLGQGSRNDIADFESQGFIKRIGRERSGFRFRDHLRVRRRPRASRGRAMDGRTDESSSPTPVDDAFRAADYSPEVRARYIKKIKAKIAEGLAVP